MSKDGKVVFTCTLCGRSKRPSEMALGGVLREPVIQLIRETYADWTIEDAICLECLHKFRSEHLRRLLEAEKGDLTSLDHEVIHSLREQEAISANSNGLQHSVCHRVRINMLDIAY
ncbi:MAG: hypothetical protein R3C28_26070 [Pirellulaceae bacterium]